ncbi:hypothetical protein ASF87_05350 [Microbacterium sp. Leaf161]|nr:hypothetical protein ASF87_05350 [Microbacterium sp. Leaf161]
MYPLGDGSYSATRDGPGVKIPATTLSDLSPKRPRSTQRIQQASYRSADKSGAGLPLRNGSRLAELTTRNDHLDQSLFARSVKSRRGSRERRPQNQDRQHSRLREEDGEQRERPPGCLRERRQTQDE